MKKLHLVVAAMLTIGFSGSALAEGMQKDASKQTKKMMMHPPFGNKDDVAFAKDIWQKISKAGFLGVHGHLYIGGPPHGKVREVVEGVVDNKLVIVKSNYGGKDVSVANVTKDPKKYLKAVTVMVKRKGYDKDDKDWFWIKYAPDGTVLKNKKGMSLAGRVAKGMPVGCISCHKSASGSDFVFSHNKIVNASVTWIGDKNLKAKFADLMN